MTAASLKRQVTEMNERSSPLGRFATELPTTAPPSKPLFHPAIIAVRLKAE
jgi:hypothetical protein